MVTTLDYTTKEGIEAILNNPYMILVNRDHRVSSNYVPSDLVSFRGGYKLNSTCSAALGKLVDAGKKAGYSYTLYSGYRTYSSQYKKYYNLYMGITADTKAKEPSYIDDIVLDFEPGDCGDCPTTSEML